MKTLFAALLAGSALFVAAPAFAADIPEPIPTAPAPEAVVPMAFDWTGAYVGANIGYLWGTFDVEGAGDVDSDQFTGGLFAGYNYMVTPNWVVGGEVDVNYADTEDFGGVDTSLWYGSARARIGYAFDSFLIYGTGGLALAYPTVEAVDDDSQLHVGWTVGAGLEAALTQNITARAEYLYTSVGDESYNLGPGALSDVDIGLDSQTVRVGLGYKF